MLLQGGNTSLHFASRDGQTELCKLLLGAKADVEAKNEVLEVTMEIDALVICVKSSVFFPLMTMMWAWE